MKKPIRAGYSLAAKTGAWFVLFIALVTAIASAAAIIVMFYLGFYVSSEDEVREKMLDQILDDKCGKVMLSYLNGETDISEKFKYDNFYFKITLSDGTTAESNYGGEEILYSETVNYNPDSSISHETDGNSGTAFTVWGAIPKTMSKTDESSILAHWISIGYKWKFAAFATGFVSLVFGVIAFIFLMCAAGHKKSSDTVNPGPLDSIPFDLHTVIIILINCLAVSVMGDIAYSIERTIICVAFLFVLDYLLLVSYFMSVASRAKRGVLFKYTLVWLVLSFIWRCVKALWRFTLAFFRNLPLLWKAILLVCALFVWNIITVAFFANSNYYGIFLWFSSWVAGAIVVFTVTLNLDKLKKGGEAIASGNLNYCVNTQNMLWDFKRHAESLNSISAGMSRAVEERLRSERFRTELITNVSHDLKTPLTSIINYIDLIKKENPENENIRNYIEVLDRQAMRLRKLTEDLVEASKASTGNLQVELASCELGELITQTAGEYNDKLKACGLELVCSRPEEPVNIMADGRHLFRVIDNLMSNIIKYAQPSTRVYLNLERKGNKAVITFRNTSKYALNISSDELMERFVRGDASRHTEGSGLGLSIAKSLMELQHGAMNITVDGDLFKVTLTFDTV